MASLTVHVCHVQTTVRPLRVVWLSVHVLKTTTEHLMMMPVLLAHVGLSMFVVSLLDDTLYIHLDVSYEF